MKYPRHNETVQSLLAMLTGDDSQLALLLDFPLHVLLFAAQIRANMWRRNGGVMGDQVRGWIGGWLCKLMSG